MEAWSNHPNVESNLHSFGSKQNRWDNGAERASPDWWPRPPHACYLYVEGSWAGDHLEQVVPHHVLAGGHRGDVLVNFPWINPNTELTGRLTDLCLHSCTLWISFSGMALSGSLSWDDGGEEVHIKSIFSVCVWFHLNFVRKKPLLKSLLWSVEWTKRQSSHSDWKRDSKSAV